MKVLLSEGSSLTAREHLTVLGRAGVKADVLSSISHPLCEFSRWTGTVHRVPSPSADPLGYLAAAGRLTETGGYDALLPTHEQAWLFAVGRKLLPTGIPLAVAPAMAFDRVQGKLAFCRLLDELDLPQPGWTEVAGVADVAGLGFPCWLKSDFSTAGRGVRLVHDNNTATAALAELARPVLAQLPAPGNYAQVGALFDRGRLVAVHTSEKTGDGAGGSAAARLSVDHPEVRAHVARVGAHLRWHGGMTFDYFHVDGRPQYIECNPRTVEPGNAAASGVDLPMLTIALGSGAPMASTVAIGRAGVRTQSALALMLGAAERTGRRHASVATLLKALTGRGYPDKEVLTPLRKDPKSALPLAIAAITVLRGPASVRALAAKVVAAYSVTPSAIDIVRSRVDQGV
ncbi:hypothetical protein CLV47_11141 [Antricoccus suffuscus]|uniref:ATP-grasp domain-containing protein n=1 Tax=Antricoccus suffuscus TaxID=1629062 RepID=A0A2T0ZXT5_9ACTN|nr:carbamoyl-phosphate-synthetase [Antricoccus suffuscus]PRZ41165.1 hypothetical protein CLV47_11141 [Antricoccus suffuscus]